MSNAIALFVAALLAGVAIGAVSDGNVSLRAKLLALLLVVALAGAALGIAVVVAGWAQ